MFDSTKQILSIPAAVWYVHVDNTFDSMWPSRKLARAHKKILRNYGIDNQIKISSSTITLGKNQEDPHS